MAIVTAVVIAGLAIAGFVYGKVRSRVPAVATPRPVTSPPSGQPTTDPTPAGTSPLDRPATDTAAAASSDPLPPPEPVSEWAPPSGLSARRF